MISLPLYYQAQCQNYTGTWQGFMANPTDLVPAKKTVTLQLISKGNRIIGKLNKKYFYAICQKGALSNIFLGPEKCGKFSQMGGLVAKNTLVLQINQQNAMMDWNLLLFLQRKNNHTSFTPPKNSTLNSVRTCH